MCIELTGQMSFYDSPDIWCGRTSEVPLARQEKDSPREQTSESCWRKLPAWSNQPLMFLSLPNGKRRESSSATDTVSLGGFTTRSIGYRRGEEESPWSRTLTGIPLPTSYLSELNVGESPIHPIESHLTDVLETDADSRYDLSAKACQGIINRSANRGKQLPGMLKTALEQTIARA